MGLIVIVLHPTTTMPEAKAIAWLQPFLNMKEMNASVMNKQIKK